MKLAWATYLGALSRINAILIPRISAHPPILAQCKVHRPWALFREGMVNIQFAHSYMYTIYLGLAQQDCIQRSGGGGGCTGTPPPPPPPEVHNNIIYSINNDYIHKQEDIVCSSQYYSVIYLLVYAWQRRIFTRTKQVVCGIPSPPPSEKILQQPCSDLPNKGLSFYFIATVNYSRACVPSRDESSPLHLNSIMFPS